MSTFRFSISKKILQLLVPKKFSIFTFGPSYLKIIFLNKILEKNHNIIRISPRKNRIF